MVSNNEQPYEIQVRKPGNSFYQTHRAFPDAIFAHAIRDRMRNQGEEVRLITSETHGGGMS